MPLLTGKNALIQMLKAEGVEYIFGNPGTTETPIMDELENHGDLQYVLVMQEGVAMGMADAYARATKKPSFVNLHIETGLANGMSLLHNANAGGTPMVLTAANLDIRELARGRTNLSKMVKELTKWSTSVTHADQIPSVIRRAFKEAITPPTGPVFIEFSANSLDDETDVDIAPSGATYPLLQPDVNSITKAAELISNATDPIIIVGDKVGESNATLEVVKIAEMLGAKVYASSYAEMNFPTSHIQFKGAIKLGFPESHNTLSSSDLVIMIGKLSTGYYMFSEPSLEYFDKTTKFVHIDNDGNHIGSTHKTDVGIIADPKVAIKKLTDALETLLTAADKISAKNRRELLAIEKEKALKLSKNRLDKTWNDKPMSSYRMMHEVARSLPKNIIVSNDSVTSSDALYDAMNFDIPGSIYGGRGGALGWGIGGAMGIKLAYPDRPVIALEGDGSAMMTIQGLWTAANSNIPVVYVICNNQSYRVLKLNMDIYKDVVLNDAGSHSEYLGMDFETPIDMVKIANGMGIAGKNIEDPDEIFPELRKALALEKPALLNIRIDGSIKNIPT